jgi:hypothetical protein
VSTAYAKKKGTKKLKRWTERIKHRLKDIIQLLSFLENMYKLWRYIMQNCNKMHNPCMNIINRRRTNLRKEEGREKVRVE